MTRRVAFFDLDRTFLDVNSGRLWLSHAWAEGDIGWAQLAWALWWLGRYALGDDRLENALSNAARSYEGVAFDAMQARVQTWFDAEVAGRARPGALTTLAAHRDAGDAIVLATSSSCFAGACAQAAWGFDDVIATDLGVVDGVLTGEVTALGFGTHKAQRCLAWLDARELSADAATFYTDSYSDLPLLEAVGHPVVVAPDRRLARTAADRGWVVQDWGASEPA